MITIITGAKDTGKSSYLESWYREKPEGVGFFSRKVFRSGVHIGYDLVLLPGMRTVPFIRVDGFGIGEDCEEIIRQGRFLFASSAFYLAEEWMESHPVLDDVPVWMDEIGALELFGYGFDRIVRNALAEGRELRVVFREHLFERLIEYYNILNYSKMEL